jgi:electron transfer flavoprotein alpha subunit
MIQVLATIGPNGKPTAVALELLGDASALARRWQGKVAVWLPTAAPVLDSTLEELVVHGADVIWLLQSERFASWSSEAIAAALTSQLSSDCRVILLPGGARGEEVAALLAGQLEFGWLPDALTFAVTRTDVLEVTATLPGGKLARIHRPASSKPVIVTMRPGVAETRKRDRPAAMDVRKVELDLSSVPSLTAVDKFLPADPRTIDLVFAERILSAGRGVGGPEGVAIVGKLAEALGASLGASRMVVDLGWAPHERQVGLTGRTVKPELYVACGISGASHHIAGMRESKHIVAINPDPKAPIHEVAHLSLPGDLQAVIPAIQMALARRAKGVS